MKSSFLKASGILFLVLFSMTSCLNDKNKIKETCFDEVQNQGETRVDCGGPNCPECPPTCDDGILTQTDEWFEEWPDCGGPCEPCATCFDGIQNSHWMVYHGDTIQVMEQGIDCGFPCSVACVPTCNDGIQNGDEIGIDCYHPDQGMTDCDVCYPSCDDGIQNGLETGIDCGSPNCGPCPPPTCDDGIQNSHFQVNPEDPYDVILVVETGIDCDNDFFTDCPDCPLATCFDGIMNGNETGIDCGGSCPNACYEIPSCSDGVQNGTETGIDCDDDPETFCPPCATCNDGILNGLEDPTAFIESNGEIECLLYDDGSGCDICVSCVDGIQNQGELFVDCGGLNTGCPLCDNVLSADPIAGASLLQILPEDITVTLSGPVNNPNLIAIKGRQYFGPDYYMELTITLPVNIGLEVGDEYVLGPTAVPGGNIARVDFSQNGEYNYSTTVPSNDELVIDFIQNIPLPPGQRRIHGSINIATLQLTPPIPPDVIEIEGQNIIFQVNY